MDCTNYNTYKIIKNIKPPISYDNNTDIFKRANLSAFVILYRYINSHTQVSAIC